MNPDLRAAEILAEAHNHCTTPEREVEWLREHGFVLVRVDGDYAGSEEEELRNAKMQRGAHADTARPVEPHPIHQDSEPTIDTTEIDKAWDAYDDLMNDNGDPRAYPGPMQKRRAQERVESEVRRAFQEARATRLDASEWEAANSQTTGFGIDPKPPMTGDSIDVALARADIAAGAPTDE